MLAQQSDLTRRGSEIKARIQTDSNAVAVVIDDIDRRSGIIEIRGIPSFTDKYVQIIDFYAPFQFASAINGESIKPGHIHLSLMASICLLGVTGNTHQGTQPH